MKRYPFELTCKEVENVTPLPPQIVKRSQQPTYRTRESYLSAQQALYEALLPRASCPITQPTLALQHRLLLNNIDLAKLNNDIHSLLVLDVSLHVELACLLDALFFAYGSDKNYLHDRVRNKISFPQVTGEEGRGSLFAVALKGEVDMFTIKTNPNLPYEQLYEYLIGKLILNPLRYEVLNFAYTYAYHACSSYFIDDRNEVTSWCITDKEQTGYLYREKIDGLTLNKWIHTYGGDDVALVEILLQIINALDRAYEIAKFQHNDLSGDNILVRELTTPVSMNLASFGGYIDTYWIPQIINLGDATAIYNGLLLRPPTRVADQEMLGDIKRLITNLAFQVNDTETALGKCAQNLPKKRGTWEGVANLIINTYNFNPLRAISSYDQVPLYFIQNSCRFYQRYFVDREYRLPEYADLRDLFREGMMSVDMAEWVNTKLNDSELDIQPMLRVIEDALVETMDHAILDQVSVSSDEQRVEVLNQALTSLTTAADYIYILSWYMRVVVPILINDNVDNGVESYEFTQELLARGAKYYTDTIQRISQYAEKLRQRLYVNDLPVSDLVPEFERLALTIDMLPSIVDM